MARSSSRAARQRCRPTPGSGRSILAMPERAREAPDVAGKRQHAAPLLEVSELRVNYGAVAAIRGVSLSVAGGEVVALLGANGAGKSTMLRTISGLSRPRSGRIALEGEAIHRLPPSRIV